MYLTPERFRTMGLGVDLDDVDDVELRSVLERASAAVDSYCSVPLLPQKFDFRGGTMTDEQHEWRSDMYDRPAPYRFWPYAKPVKEVTSFRIYSTPNVYVEIDAAEMFINNNGGYIEVSSLKLTQFGIFGAGVLATLIGMYNPVARMTYTYGWEFPIVGEYLEPTDAYTYRAQHQFWSDADVTVFVNAAEVTTGFTVDRTEGTIVFDDPQAAEDIVTASYTYTLPSQIASATGIIAADAFGESSLRERGMGSLEALTVGEISMRRGPGAGQRGSVLTAETLPQSARALLSGFLFISAR